MAENILKRKCGIYSTPPEVNLKNMTFLFAFLFLDTESAKVWNHSKLPHLTVQYTHFFYNHRFFGQSLVIIILIRLGR